MQIHLFLMIKNAGAFCKTKLHRKFLPNCLDWGFNSKLLLLQPTLLKAQQMVSNGDLTNF